MNPVKPLIVLGTGGTLATGAYLTKGYGLPDSKEKPKSISQVLASNKYVPLDTSKATGGDAVLDKYKVANPSGAKDVSQLQEECKVLTSKEFNDADYKKARRWCVEEQTVAKRLGLFNRTALSTVTSTNTNDDQGRIKINNHKLPTSTNKLNHTFGEEENDNLSTIKSKCLELSTKTNIDETFEDDFSKSFDWCSIDKPAPQG